jgi:hypothetical protein
MKIRISFLDFLIVEDIEESVSLRTILRSGDRDRRNGTFFTVDASIVEIVLEIAFTSSRRFVVSTGGRIKMRSNFL